MAKRLQLRRGTTTPGSIFYEGEPVYDTSAEVLYIGDTGGAGSGTGSAVASEETYLSALELLARATASAAGSINFYEDTDNGTDRVTLQAPAALGTGVTFTLPALDGNNGDVLVTDGNGVLSLQAPAASSFTITDEGAGSETFNTGETLDFEAGEGIDTAVIKDAVAGITTVTISGEDASDANKGIASFQAADFDVTAGDVALEDTVVKTVTTDSGALTPATHGFSILGGEGMDVTHTDQTITVEGEIASSTNTGISSFSSDDFDVAAGGLVTLADSATGAVTAINGTANEVEVSRTNGTVTVGLPDDVTIGGTLTVTQDLNVLGTAVTFSAETVKVEDRILELALVNGAAPASATTWDPGVVFNYHDGTSALKSGIIWLDNEFIGIASAITETADTGTADPQVTINEYAPVVAAELFLGGTSRVNDLVINSNKEAVNFIFDGGTYS
jgi:hypothetical protein